MQQQEITEKKDLSASDTNKLIDLSRIFDMRITLPKCGTIAFPPNPIFKKYFSYPPFGTGLALSDFWFIFDFKLTHCKSWECTQYGYNFSNLQTKPPGI